MRKSFLLAFTFFALVFSAFGVYAHECHNDHKQEGAGLQAIGNNGGTAGFVIRPDGVEVFIHPSVSQDPFLSTIFDGAQGNFIGLDEAGSLLEGAHNSAGWSQIPFIP